MAANTLAAPYSFEETIKRSRFLAHAAPVGSAADAMAFLDAVADPAATHNCWAWRIEPEYRFSDDGEPGGTAGRPLLGAVEARDLDRVMVVVTRYFGGIKLGAGGLARAYAGTAAKCLGRAALVPVVRKSACSLEAGFEHSDAVYRTLGQFRVEVLDERFGPQGLQLRLSVADDDLAALGRALQDCSRGQAALQRLQPQP